MDYLFFFVAFSFSFKKNTVILLRFLNCTYTLHTELLLDKVLKLDVMVFWFFVSLCSQRSSVVHMCMDPSCLLLAPFYVQA